MEEEEEEDGWDDRRSFNISPASSVTEHTDADDQENWKNRTKRHRRERVRGGG